MEDLLPLLESFKPCEDGVGVVGLDEPVAQLAGESRVASDNLSTETSEEGGESSSVLGTNTQRFNPSASFTFFHLLPIFHFQISKPTKTTKTQNLKLSLPQENHKEGIKKDPKEN